MLEVNESVRNFFSEVRKRGGFLYPAYYVRVVTVVVVPLKGFIADFSRLSPPHFLKEGSKAKVYCTYKGKAFINPLGMTPGAKPTEPS